MKIVVGMKKTVNTDVKTEIWQSKDKRKNGDFGVFSEEKQLKFRELNIFLDY